MAGRWNLVEVKFRLDDGSDIGPSRYSPATTVTTLKERIIAQWPRERANGQKTISNLKLISAGKILENHWTLADAIHPLRDLPGAVVTMHVVILRPLTDKKNEKLEERPFKDTGMRMHHHVAASKPVVLMPPSEYENLAEIYLPSRGGSDKKRAEG